LDLRIYLDTLGHFFLWKQCQLFWVRNSIEELKNSLLVQRWAKQKQHFEVSQNWAWLIGRVKTGAPCVSHFSVQNFLEAWSQEPGFRYPAIGGGGESLQG
jgi:hypothetical protein